MWIGKKVPQKLAEVRQSMKDMDADCFIVTALDDIACKLFPCKNQLKLFPNKLAYTHALTLFFFFALPLSSGGLLFSFAWKKGLLNLRGSDFEYAPLFFAYAIVTDNDTYLYVLKEERANNNKIDNHFQTEHTDVIIREYNNILAGISLVVRF